MGSITIGKPYICAGIDSSRVRLCADIKYDKSVRVLYYEVDCEYEKFLNVETADCFVLGLLHSCMNEKLNIDCEVPITEQLLFQLKNFYIPVISKNMPDLFPIELNAVGVPALEHMGSAVATGNSGGVDSFYTIVRYLNENEEYKLTHLLFNNISTEDDDEKRIRAWFEKEKREKDQIAKELGLQSIFLYSNLFSFYQSHFIYNYYYAAQYISAPYALIKLIGKYYYSSSCSFSDFTINHKKMASGSNFDLLAIDCFSTRNLRVYSTGSETGRIQKTIAISNNNVANRHLQVCAVEQNKQYMDNLVKVEKLNCGKCRKCVRTVTTLYSIGQLNRFEDVFDLSLFYNNKDKYIARGLAGDLYEFSDELTAFLRSNKKYSFKIKFWRAAFKIRYVIARSRFLVRLYHAITNKGKK